MAPFILEIVKDNRGVTPNEQVGLLLRLVNHRYEEAQRVAWGTVVGLLGGRLSVTVE